jgi:hypothetical protein
LPSVFTIISTLLPIYCLTKSHEALEITMIKQIVDGERKEKPMRVQKEASVAQAAKSLLRACENAKVCGIASIENALAHRRAHRGVFKILVT